MRNNTREIVAAVVVLTIAGIIAVVVAAYNGEDMAALIIGSIIGLLAPTVTALLAFLKSSNNQDQLTDVAHKVDNAAALVAADKLVDISTEKAVVITPKEAP